MTTRGASGTLALSAMACIVVTACSRPAPERPPDTATAAPAPMSVEELEAAVPENPMKEAYFGEQHLHTAYSLDGYIGGARLRPADAYRFAQGEEVEVGGRKVRLARPLDWAAVTDHAEYIGEMFSTWTLGAPGHEDPKLEELRALETIEERESWFLEYVVESNRGTTPQHPPFFAGEETTRSGWQEILTATEAAYVPGRFTTLPAFEWSAAPRGGNLHRNVFFRDTHVPDRPMSYIDINDEEGLWAWLAECEGQGMRVLAIPHNSNASKGMMFPETDRAGDPVDLEYAEMRSRFEPLVEMMQIKGSSEVHRWFWGADELADFENADSIGDYSDRDFRKYGKRNWVRWGVTRGLTYERSLGVNPFRYGFVGGTDNHNATMGNVDEDNFATGSHGAADGSVELRRSGEVGGWIKGRDLNPGALTGVWAAQNTRAAIWDALAARETFATSGPRIKARFFGRLGPIPTPADARSLVEQGYAEGVAMGGTLRGDGRAPSFAVWAIKDPDGANLDRIQIVKGWVDADGEPQDRVFDVVWAGDRKPGVAGRLPPVGNTVDLAMATYTNTIGEAELLGSWSDPTFDPSQHALYYVRVLEIPTPRWSTYDSVRAGLPLLEGVPATIQERAWSSPIWYTPVSDQRGNREP